MSLDARGRSWFPKSACGSTTETPSRWRHGPSFYILDAYSLIFQVFHAIPEMTGPAGPADAGGLRDLPRPAQPGEGPQARLPGGRLRRPGPGLSLGDLRGIQGEPEGDARRPGPADPGDPPACSRASACPCLMEPEMEADDVIATLARRGDERGLDVFIVTADKDARQLIGDHVRLLNLRNKKEMDAAGPREGLGHPARPGRRLPGADRRHGRQRPGRARHRPGLRRRRSSRSSARSTASWRTPTGSRGPRSSKASATTPRPPAGPASW